MSIRVLYFASVSEAIGLTAETIDLPAHVTTLGALRQHLGARHPALLTTKNLRAAVNRRMCDWDATLDDGAEVAFFPPVTGG
jgi:molybdopterin synthase sulfur carrier subunit